MKKIMIAALLGSSVLPSFAHTQSNDDFGVYFEIDAEKSRFNSNKHEVPQAKLFVPLSHTDNTITFVDMRSILSGDIHKNFNIGVGHRRLINETVLLGANASAGKVQAKNDRTYKIGSVGVEVITNNFAIKANGYVPLSGEDERELYDTHEISAPYLDGNKAYFTHYLARGVETVHSGYDIEATYFINDKLSVSAEYYNFEGEYKGSRVKASYEDKFSFIDSDNLTFKVEVGAQKDNKNDDVEAYGHLSVRYKFGANNNYYEDLNLSKRTNASFLHDQLDSFPFRKNDVYLSETHTTDSYVVQGEFNVEEKKYSEFSYHTANEDLREIIENAQPNSMVVLDGSAGDWIINEALQTKEGQSLVGGSTPILVTGPNGERGIVIMPGHSATVYGKVGQGIELTSTTSMVNVEEILVDDFTRKQADYKWSFEGHDYDGRTWKVLERLNGWKVDRESSDAGIEIQTGDLVVDAHHGDTVLELDAHKKNGFTESNAHVFQKFKTEEGGVYQITFWYQSRRPNKGSSNDFSVRFEGEELDVEYSNNASGWQQMTAVVKAKSVNGKSKLEFIGEGAADSYGALIDDIRIRKLN